MASITLEGSNDWSGHSANRILKVEVSASSGSTSASYTVSSRYTYTNGSYTRVALDIAGSNVFDTGYQKNFNQFPCKQNSSRSGSATVPSTGNISVRLRGGVSHDNLTDIDVSGTLVRASKPSYNWISASEITRTSVKLTASINNNGASLTGGGWDYTTDSSKSTWTYANGGPTSKTITGLAANTTYYYRGYAENSVGGTNSGWSSFTTSGNPPVINSITPAPSRTSCSLANNSISYDTNAWFSSVTVKYGTTASYGSTVNSTSITGLQPNTTYYYSMTVKDNWGRTSSAKTGSFKTTCNAPSNLTLTRTSGTTNSMTIALSASGDTNAPITNYTLYYRLGTSGNYSSVNYGTATSKVISSLSSDQNYQMYFTATNAAGTSTSSTVTHSPLLTNPSISSFQITNLLPFTCTATVVAGVNPSRTLNYRFSKDGGNTWTAYQTSNIYNWTGLNEETTYTMVVQVKAIHTSVDAVDTTATTSVVIKTPADQAKIRRMIDGRWVKGKTFIKVNGKWVKAKKLYIRVNGQWKLNNNEK